jgi:hypothetical protein
MYTQAQFETSPAPRTHWIKRMGVAGFSFFMIKGLFWLLIPLLAHTTLFN